MEIGLRVVMLLTDGFGGTGGIAKFNRDFLNALDSCSLVERVRAFPRLIPEPIGEAVPEAVVYDRKACRGKLAFVLRVAGVIWRREAVDLVICGHLHLLALAWILARLRGARLALVIHGVEAWIPSRKLLANRAARRVDGFISVSRYSAERFASWCRVPIDRAYILPNCVDLDRFQPNGRDMKLLQRYGLHSSKIIMTVGRLAAEERYKGFDEVIEIMPELLKKFPTLKYLIVGDGRDRARLESKVATLRLLNSVIFAGYVPESEKVAHYNLADVYVMPSSGEGFGIVLIEAAACGIPVVGSRADGSREALLDGVLGRLIDPKSSDELVEAVTALLGNAPSRRRVDDIKVFSGQKFKARVAEWCRSQVTHNSSGG